MVQGRKIVVVIPAYNEECYIRDVIGTLPDFVDCIPGRRRLQHGQNSGVRPEYGDDRVEVLRTSCNLGVGAMCLGYARLLNGERMLS